MRELATSQDDRTGVGGDGQDEQTAGWIARLHQPPLEVARRRLVLDDARRRPDEADHEADGLLEIGQEEVEDEQDILVLGQRALVVVPPEDEPVEEEGEQAQACDGGDEGDDADGEEALFLDVIDVQVLRVGVEVVGIITALTSGEMVHRIAQNVREPSHFSFRCAESSLSSRFPAVVNARGSSIIDQDITSCPTLGDEDNIARWHLPYLITTEYSPGPSLQSSPDSWSHDEHVHAPETVEALRLGRGRQRHE